MDASDVVADILEHHGVKGMRWGVRKANRVGDIVVSRGLGISTTGNRQRSAERSAAKSTPKKAKDTRAVVVRDKGKRLKTSGGKGHPAHPDAVRVRTLGQVGKKSGLKALSNEELQAYNQRLNLEQQAKRLSYNDKSPPKKFVLTLLGQTGKQQASEAANTVASAQVKKLLNKAA
jgi:hypothetical protein